MDKIKDILKYCLDLDFKKGRTAIISSANGKANSQHNPKGSISEILLSRLCESTSILKTAIRM